MNYTAILIITFSLFIPSTLFAWLKAEQPFIIMLDPSGDARHTGRPIDSTFERAITLRYAHEVQQKLTDRMPQCVILISRQAGDTLQPLQNASFANQNGIDLYISFGCYHQESLSHRIDLYYFSYGTAFVNKRYDLALYPYHEAYLFNLPITKTWASVATQALHRSSQSIQIGGPYAIPIHPLIGIMAPAFFLEMNIKNTNDWDQYLEPLVSMIEHIVSYTRHS